MLTNNAVFARRHVTKRSYVGNAVVKELAPNMVAPICLAWVVGVISNQHLPECAWWVVPL